MQLITFQRIINNNALIIRENYYCSFQNDSNTNSIRELFLSIHRYYHSKTVVNFIL
jgi:hypothetical protein